MSAPPVFIACCLAAAIGAFAAENDAPLKAEQIFSDTTVLALMIPDLAGSRQAAQASWIGEMFQQREIQEFLSPAVDKMKKIYEDLRAGNPMLPALEDIDSGMFSGEIAAAFYSRGPGNALGGVFTLKPRDAEAFRRLLPENVRQWVVEGVPIPIGNNPQDPAVTFMKGRILFCWPQSDIGKFMGRIRGNVVDPKTTLAGNSNFELARMKAGRSAAWVYAAPKSILDLLSSDPALPAAERQKMGALVKLLGLDAVDSFAGGVGFIDRAPVFEGYVGFAMPPVDGLGFLVRPAAALRPEALKVAAADAPYVNAFTFQIAALLPLFDRALEIVNPEAAPAVAEIKDLASQVLGFDLQKDLFENFGSEIVVAQTGVDTAAPLGMVPGLIVSVPLKDTAKVESCLAKVSEALDKSRAEGLGKFKFRKMEHAGKPVWYLGGQILAGPVALSVCGDRLLIGTSLNAVRRSIEQLQNGASIIDNRDFQQVIARLTGKPFDASALPGSFSFAADRSSGTGSLLLSGLALSAGTVALAGLAELPPPPNARIVPTVSHNENSAMKLCMGFEEAQDTYHQTDHDEDGVLEYAQTLKGKFSLLERSEGAADLLLIDKDFAAAEGEPSGKAAKNGYRFKVLTEQGPAAPGGAKSYLDKGNLVHGYAMVAYPAQYGVSGNRCFMINNNGTIYSHDLGAQTAELVAKMTAFEPSEGWTPVEVKFDEDGNFAGEAFFTGLDPDGLMRFFSKPSGKAVMSVLSSVDLGLWPDEGFFRKFRNPTGSITVAETVGIYMRMELPPPTPASVNGISPMAFAAGASIVAAVAVPSLLRSRTIANQVAAASACKAYIEAQELYRRTDYDNDFILEYAQSLRGNNSLFEKKAGAADLQLIDRTLAYAEGDPGKGAPKAGYLFKVLKGQGPSAPGGKKSYLTGPNMVNGCALVAYPATWNSTGRETFIISNAGTLYHKDLGDQTHTVVRQMTEFDPDESWSLTE